MNGLWRLVFLLTPTSAQAVFQGPPGRGERPRSPLFLSYSAPPAPGAVLVVAPREDPLWCVAAGPPPGAAVAGVPPAWVARAAAGVLAGGAASGVRGGARWWMIGCREPSSASSCAWLIEVWPPARITISALDSDDSAISPASWIRVSIS